MKLCRRRRKLCTRAFLSLVAVPLVVFLLSSEGESVLQWLGIHEDSSGPKCINLDESGLDHDNTSAPQQQQRADPQENKKHLREQHPQLPKTSYPLTLDSPYVLNSPRICKQVEPLHVLVIVHTATHHFQRRRLIRETWASKNLMKTRNQRVLFLLGLPTNISIQRMIENELLVHGDLVQGQFMDTYHNLTHKGVMAYRWINQYCPQAQMILKVDDDMFVNPFLFYDVYFPRLSLRNRTMICHVVPNNTSPIQRKKGKWIVQDFEFRGYKRYPVKYCMGYIVIITPDIIEALYRTAYTTPFFWVDDVYLYGMLPAKVGNILYMDVHKQLNLKCNYGLRCFRRPNCLILATFAPTEAAVNELWNLTLGRIPEHLKSDVNPSISNHEIRDITSPLIG